MYSIGFSLHSKKTICASMNLDFFMAICQAPILSDIRPLFSILFWPCFKGKRSTSLWPRDAPNAWTCAHDLLNGSSNGEGPTDVQADGWITHEGSRRYSIREDSIRIGHDLVLSLLWWKKEQQLLDLGDEDEDEED